MDFRDKLIDYLVKKAVSIFVDKALSAFTKKSSYEEKKYRSKINAGCAIPGARPADRFWGALICGLSGAFLIQ